MRMPSTRVTVTLPAELVEAIDRLEKNRSRFVLEGVRREVTRRRKEALRRSLARPHAESLQLAEEGLAAWSGGLPQEEPSELVEPSAGTPVRWLPDEGWVAGEE
jgi:post-segregation antitoxin (ccd killing protein)